MKYGDKITVVTLSYKNYKNIYDTIDSVLAQDYPNIEYIISDDGCDLFPQNEIQNYINNCNSKLKSYVVRKNNCNVGTVEHENIVCDLASGEYIIEVACGDSFYASNTVSEIVKKIIATDAELLVFTRIVYSENGKPLYYLPHYRDVRRINKMDARKQYEAFVSGYFYDMASGSSMAYKSSFVQKQKFDRRYKLIEDYPLFTKYSWERKIECCYDIVAIKYVLGGVSNTRNPLVAKDMQVYNEVERLEHINEVNGLIKEIIKYQKYRSKGKKWFLVFRFPIVLLWIVKYRMNQKIGIFIDKKLIRRNVDASN